MASAGRLTQVARKSHAMGPSVRNLINQYKLDPNQIASTGPHQTLLKGDILSHLSSHRSGNDPARESSSVLSAPKPVMDRLSLHQVDGLSIKRYRRRTLTELEIEVINSGGLIDAPSAKQDTSKLKKR